MGDGLRLLEVGVRWPPETFLQRKFRGLSSRGVQVTVASGASRREASRPRAPGIELVRLHHPGERTIFTIAWAMRDATMLALRNPRLLIRLVGSTRPRRLLRNVLPLALARPDVIHFEWEAQGVRYLSALDALDRPVVVSCRGAGIAAHPHAGLEGVTGRYPELFAKASAVHCVSEAMRDEAAGLGLEPAKARVIRSGVDSAFFSPGSRTESPTFRVVSIGTLHWIKNLEDGVRGIALLAGRGVDASYAIVGPEPPPGDAVKSSDRARILFLAQELGVVDRIELLGELSHEGVRDRLRSSDALLLPSVAEGIPNCVLEAMACAVPVVVTDCGGIGEAVTDGVEGLVCPRRDPAALASALERLHRDPSLARRLGEAGRERALSDFTLDREVDETMRMYAEVTGARQIAEAGRRGAPAPAAHR